MVDLQKGERYAVASFTFTVDTHMALLFVQVLQYGPRTHHNSYARYPSRYHMCPHLLRHRMSMVQESPEAPSHVLDIFLSTLLYWHVVIPKFHLRGHGKICQLKFNMNFTKGAGRMTGEMIESGWAQSGPTAISTRENGPFARRATLDDHWAAENWRKLHRLRKCFGFQSLLCILILHFRCHSPQKPKESARLEQDAACHCRQCVAMSPGRYIG